MRDYKHSELYYSEFKRQLLWRKEHIKTTEYGFQFLDKVTGEPVKFPHIVPFEIWDETLYRGIRADLTSYIQKPGQEINIHSGVHNLLSSWVLCANLYFYTRTNDNFRTLMLRFLQQNVSLKIIELTDVELEFAFPEYDPLHPKYLLGERYGSRGSKQTSPDLAFIVKTKTGKGIILTECKYTEGHFYPCSTCPDPKHTSRNPNPDFSRCLNPKKDYDYKSICHQKNKWKRNYMDLIEFSPVAESVLLHCPAATDGYQLFRQQALAEGIAKSGRFDLVVSSVALDGRNGDLIHCLDSTGVKDFQTDWGPLFNGKTLFKTWTHQEWVQFARTYQVNGEFDDWLGYMNERYGY